MATPQTLKETRDALIRIQGFDTATLARVADLGRELNFQIAVEPSERIVEIYKRLPASILDDLTDDQLNQIKGQAQADYNLFTEILNFSSSRENAASQRTSLVNKVQARRDQLFNALWQYISYGVARVTDTSLLESEARATIQTIKDQANELTESLTANKKAADDALVQIRSAAAEQGVTQQAEHFKREADQQEQSAGEWLTKAYWFAGGVGVFAVIRPVPS